MHMYHDVPVTFLVNQVENMPNTRLVDTKVYKISPEVACICFTCHNVPTAFGIILKQECI